jgi:predicted Na+-dependent transporter
MMVLADIAVSVLVPLVLAVVLNRIWPSVSGPRLAVVAGLAMPAALATLFLAGVWRLSSPDDWEGLTYAMAPFVGAVLVLLNAALTLPVAFLTLHALRKRAAR